MLLVPEPAIDIAALEQLVVPSGVVNPAALQHQYHVGGYQHRQAVRNDHEGAAFGDAQKVGVDDRLAFRVERARRFVEDQDARIADQCASDCEALALTAREVGRPFLYEGLVAARQMLDEFLRTGQTRRVNDILKARFRLCRSNRLADRAAEQETVLQYHARRRRFPANHCRRS